MSDYFTMKWLPEGKLRLLDQRALPAELVYVDYDSPAGVADAIRQMVVRGAPAIGVAAAYGLAIAARNSTAEYTQDLLEELQQAGAMLKAARPTAVNLFWAVDRVLNRVALLKSGAPGELRAAVLAEAQKMEQEDIETNKQIGLNGLSLVPQKAAFIHHCNTGALATVDYGTALGLIRTAHEHGREVFVYVDETRPRLQGARLTAWELKHLGIPHALIVDGASGYIMKNRGVDLVTVGCDRVAANGDTANKVGTYNLALVAKAHHVPFYIVGPTSTIDLDIPSGDFIEIEERGADEIIRIGKEMVAPEGTPVCNPAFDVTPAELITAIITERGVIYPPFTENIRKVMGV
jgi:methylthioribose-1-phosphate isomerase